ncbi:Hsp70 family protein [Pseudooceanicola sp. 502str34]
MDRLAIDFGTSNSAVALPYNGGIYRIPIERGGDTLPTAVFFPASGGMRIGTAAAEALIAGEEGRYMRALKSVLGLPLLHEKRLIGGQRRTLAEVITAFLAELRTRSEAATGLTFRRALSGRPVHFHSNDPEKDAQAEADLRACYLAAGFEQVDFLPEPEAAVLASHALAGGARLGLIVDIGGGTSDFTVFRTSADQPEIIASHGIRLGGTDFDQSVSLTHAMPLLGLGSELRREMGSGLLPVPRAPYVDLATWAKIPFVYTPETRRLAKDMLRLAVEPEKIERFRVVVEEELGHGLAFAVEKGKIAANGPGGTGEIRMGEIEKGLVAPVTVAGLDAAMAPHGAALSEAMVETLARAGVRAEEVQDIILVGGSSLMGFVAREARALMPGAELRSAEAFTAVVDGLALAVGRG